MGSTEDEHLQDLQVRLTFLDDAVAGLASADTELSRRLAMIERKLDVMRAELVSLRAASDHDPESEPPPPHY
ncbi:MAG: SlyX family protein [Rhodanobacteraceae bacterium]